MAEHGLILDNGTNINLSVKDNTQYELGFGMSINPGQPTGGYNYNNLRNKPSISGVILQGNLTLQDLNGAPVYFDTTNNWNTYSGLISEKNAVYVYTDYKQVSIGNNVKLIPGIKIGDGSAYLIDLPFITDSNTQTIANHIADTQIHTNSVEKGYWNNKVTCNIDQEDSENLIFSF